MATLIEAIKQGINGLDSAHSRYNKLANQEFKLRKEKEKAHGKWRACNEEMEMAERTIRQGAYDLEALMEDEGVGLLVGPVAQDKPNADQATQAEGETDG